MTHLRVRILRANLDQKIAQELCLAIEDSETAASCNHTDPSATLPPAIDLVICVWTDNTDKDAGFFREYSAWERAGGVTIHNYKADGANIPPYVAEECASTFDAIEQEDFALWLEKDVFAQGVKNGDAPIITMDDALNNYRFGLIEKLSQIEVIGSKENLNLDDVFLPLALRNEEGLSTDLVSRILSNNRTRIFVEGIAGSGKSTLLKHAAIELSRKDKSRIGLPIFMKASDILKSGFDELDKYVKLIIKGMCSSSGHTTASIIANADTFPEKQCLLLVDGIDELSPQNRAKIKRLITLFETQHTSISIVVSGRPSGMDSELWSDYTKLDIKPLEHNQSLEYIRKHSGATGDQLIKLVKDSEQIAELASVPFLLSLMVSYAGTTAALPNERAKLISLCISSLIHRRPIRTVKFLDEIELMDCFCRVSYRLFKLDPSGMHGEHEYIFAFQEFLATRPIGRDASRNPQSDARLLLKDIVESTGLLQRISGQIGFIHRSIWEFFVGSHLSKISLSEVASYSFSSEWEEPIRLMAGLVEKGKLIELLENIWPHNPGLALRSLPESKYDLAHVIIQLVQDTDDAEMADLVRDLSRRLKSSHLRYRNEKVCIDTLSVLLPLTTNAEILWESIQLLLELETRNEIAHRMIKKILGLSTSKDRLLKIQSELNFINVEGGKFIMGTDDLNRSVDERPAHEVKLDGFEISDIPLQNLHKDSYPYDLGFNVDERSNSNMHPIIGVTWYEAQLVAAWFGCRLPTEAEWEYACRAYGQDDVDLTKEKNIPEYAWYAENSNNTTHPPRQKRANSLGLYDMLGNVREWCEDWFSSSYYAECVDNCENPQGPTSGTNRVLRGGCFDWNTKNLVPTYRNSNLPNNRGFQNGVRLTKGLNPVLVELLKDNQQE